MTAHRLAGAIAVASLTFTDPGAAYCRATTCDPTVQDCADDSTGCQHAGLPVYWASGCLTVSVQADGAPNAGIDFDAARASVERAFAAWTGVDCPGGGRPSIRVNVDGPVACAASEYNSDKRNANVVMFRDEVWPYGRESQDVLGYTRIRFDPDTGELYDVDIEINAVDEPLSVDRTPGKTEVDLDSVIAHEVGHLLGLNHTSDASATMVGAYLSGSVEARTPARDDIDGICTVYPPDREPKTQSCEPRHGFSELCGADQQEPTEPTEGADAGGDPTVDGGCSIAGRAGGGARNLGPLALVAALLLRRRSPRWSP